MAAPRIQRQGVHHHPTCTNSQDLADWSVNGGILQDRYFKLDYGKGPFFSVKAFNDWVFAAGTRQIPGPDGVEYGPYADFLKLPDTSDIHFAHGDLTLGNIIISCVSGNYKITGIIDWELGGTLSAGSILSCFMGWRIRMNGGVKDGQMES
ncbi:hypothetical protein G6O67_006255 [Ophiocordyceps sinensis]|uniref:Aminoglycoside phosphotransferase domain-containing protein n=2 Tax=Ophiocordyceps sinensis TaxID=72228 RepID=A0A8H4PMT7_9HYPO|nr:phosphotransferase enzyme family protein [Ophiocordyceps sinensis CO18]KAF4506139.1 hypothetical protein G6O67_006255 [Ophiocordyceps sinensis]